MADRAPRLIGATLRRLMKAEVPRVDSMRTNVLLNRFGGGSESSTYGQLTVVLSDADAVRFATLASVTLMLYDHILTVAIEELTSRFCQVERIWSYITPPMIVFNAIGVLGFCCYSGSTFIYESSIVVLTLRELPSSLTIYTVARSGSNGKLDGHNKIVCRSLILLYFCGLGSMLGILGFLYRGTPNRVTMALMIYKSIRLLFRKAGSPTMRLLSRDSLIYFSIMFSVLISNLFIFKYAPPFFSSLLIGPSSSIACIAAARMMMNLRSLRFDPRLDAELFPDGYEMSLYTQSTNTTKFWSSMFR
ncbi:hypothetical protein BU17DRAFT_68865 [Hysterangium stoloniferum]|nr:hypothetical protein BU17DRAFT_68865 [Hysterangium stoloniferum]